MNIDAEIRNGRVSRLLQKDELDLNDLKFILEYLSSRNDMLWDDLFDICRSSRVIDESGIVFLTDHLLCRKTDLYIKSFCIQMMVRASVSTDELKNIMQSIEVFEKSYSLKTQLGVEAYLARIYVMRCLGMSLSSCLVSTLKKNISFGLRIWIYWLLIRDVLRLRKGLK